MLSVRLSQELIDADFGLVSLLCCEFDFHGHDIGGLVRRLEKERVLV